MEALQTAVEGAMQSGVEHTCTTRLSRLVLESKVDLFRKLDVFHRALTGERLGMSSRCASSSSRMQLGTG